MVRVKDCLQRQRRNARFRSLSRGLKRRNGRVPVSQATMRIRDCLVLRTCSMACLRAGLCPQAHAALPLNRARGNGTRRMTITCKMYKHHERRDLSADECTHPQLELPLKPFMLVGKHCCVVQLRCVNVILHLKCTAQPITAYNIAC